MLEHHLMKAYAPQNVTFERGEGCWLWDTEGKKYLDALAGIAVVSLGHSHAKISQVISEQTQKLMQVSNGFHIQEQEALADELNRLTGMDGAFFANSGAEANEAAIKIARLHGNRQGIQTPTIVVMEKAFHGRTMATLTASGSPKVKEGLEPLVEGFVRCPYGDLHALEELLKAHDNIVGVMLEPIQGEGGLHVPNDDYLPGVRKLCDQYNTLMILDEVQTGVGRTGKLFAYQHYNITPDLLTSAKALGNGFPVGACLGWGKAAEIFQPGNHGSTYGGNPLACKVAHTVLDTIENENLLNHVNEMGNYLVDRLKNVFKGRDEVIEVRGKGLMVGIELDRPCLPLRAAGLEKGLVFNVTANSVIRLVPPLVINKDEIDHLVKGLGELVAEFVAA